MVSIEGSPKKTYIYVMDFELWEWAKYQARLRQLKVSEYVFLLIKKEKEGSE